MTFDEWKAKHARIYRRDAKTGRYTKEETPETTVVELRLPEDAVRELFEALQRCRGE